MRFYTLIVLFFNLVILGAYSQSRVHRVYYDQSHQHIKEEYHLNDRDTNLLEGEYRTYFHNGNLKTIGHYKNNHACCIWQYFFQNGKIKMEGDIHNFDQHGHWKYYYEKGGLSMEGPMDHGKKNGYWKFYYENGLLKSEGQMKENHPEGLWKYYYEDAGFKAEAFFKGGKGHYKEYYETSTALKAEGRIEDGKSDSLWVYYYPSGAIKSTGFERKGMKEGDWKYFHENGALSATGTYKNDLTEGKWRYYYDNGKIKTEGIESKGLKEGYWKTYYETGEFKAEASYTHGNGIYTEFYASGKTKLKGEFIDGKYEGKWLFYYEDGGQEGECEYKNGLGPYTGYYADKTKKMEGMLKDGNKIGVWKLYKNNGEFAGYYRTYYDIDHKESNELQEVPIIKADTAASFVQPPPKSLQKVYPKQKIRYFRQSRNRYSTLIASANPLATVLNTLPFYFEYYVQEKYGVEYFFILYKSPFFESADNQSLGQLFTYGQSTGIKVKFYQQALHPIGMPYFGFELRYRNLQNSAFVKDSLTTGLDKSQLTLFENAYEVTFIMGDRWMKYTGKPGWTFDFYCGIGAGFQAFSQNYVSTPDKDMLFNSINRSAWTIPLRFGISFGYAF